LRRDIGAYRVQRAELAHQDALDSEMIPLRPEGDPIQIAVNEAAIRICFEILAHQAECYGISRIFIGLAERCIGCHSRAHGGERAFERARRSRPRHLIEGAINRLSHPRCALMTKEIGLVEMECEEKRLQAGKRPRIERFEAADHAPAGTRGDQREICSCRTSSRE